MSLIALLNLAKDYLHQAHIQRSLGHLNDHYLNDLGFYRDHGTIRPISPASHQEQATEAKQSPPIQPIENR